MITKNFKYVIGNFLAYNWSGSNSPNDYGSLTDINGNSISVSATAYSYMQLNYLGRISSNNYFGTNIFNSSTEGASLYCGLIPGTSTIEPEIDLMTIDPSDRSAAGLSYITAATIRGVSNKQGLLYTQLWQNSTKNTITVNCSYFLLKSVNSTVLIERTKFTSPIVLEPNEYLNLHYELSIE